MKKQCYVKISGKVQGVFFRSETEEKAVEFGLTGWVRNTPDGFVEAVVQGEEEKLQRFLEWCKKGPEAAQVENVEIAWQEMKESFRDFSIRYY